MERHFVQEDDAVFWCQVMSAAQPTASGVWMVARNGEGRSLRVTQQCGLLHAVGEALPRIREEEVAALHDAPELTEAEVAQLAESGVAGVLSPAALAQHQIEAHLAISA